MGLESFDGEIQELQDKVARFRKRAAGEETRSGLAADVLTELSNVLEELRVSSEELNRQHQELMLAHAEREQERRKYLDLFQSAPDGYVVTDHGGIVQEVNETAERLLGVPSRTLCAAPLSFRLVPGDLPSFREMLLSDAPVQVEELRLRRRGYGTFLATVTRTVIRNDQGAVTGHRWSIHDLTTVKEQEKRLRESEGLLRSLVDGAKDFAIFRLDVSGNVASWNTGAERIFGYTAEEVVGQSFDIFRAPEDQDTSQKQLLELADRHGRSEIEGWRVHRNGKRIWTNSVTTPLRDTRGRLTGFVKVLRDVTDRRRTEEALAERSRLLALQANVGAALTEVGELPPLLQACAQAILFNLGATLVRVWTTEASDGSLRLEALVGNDPTHEIGAILPATSSEEPARIARRKQPRMGGAPLELMDPSSRGWAEGEGLSWYAGHPLILGSALLGVIEIFSREALDAPSQLALETLARSIALGIDRLRAESRLAQTLHQLEQIMETMPEAVFTLDPDGRLLQWSRKLETATGLSRQQLQARLLADLVPRDEAERVKEMVSKAFVAGQAEWEGHVAREDGSFAPISWALVSRRDAHQRVIGLTGSGRDISERRESEMRLAQLSRRLLHLREEEQRRISRELHDSTAQNLAALCMSVTALSMPETRLDPRSRQLVAEVGELAERCLQEVRTISYLLHPPLLDEVGLRAALRWYAKGFSKRSGVKTRIQLPADLGRLHADLEIAIFRIVQESLTNVHRHAQAGSVVVGLRLAKSSLVLEVADNGGGIPAIRDRSSKAGRREAHPKRPSKSNPNGSSSSRSDIDWMGLGLVGIRERVQERHGRFEIESTDKGTTLRVELPIQERAVS